MKNRMIIMVILMSVMLFGLSDKLFAQGNASDAAVGPVPTGTGAAAGGTAGGASGPPDGNGGGDEASPNSNGEDDEAPLDGDSGDNEVPPENDIDIPDDLNFVNGPAGTYVWPDGPGTKPIWVPKGKTYHVPYKGKLIKIEGGSFKGKIAK